MAIHGYKGGVISATPPTTSVSGASGVWTTDDALQAGANWPVAPALSTNSVRLRASASAYMSRTPSTTSNRKTYTYSAWVKRGQLASNADFFLYQATGTGDFGYRFRDDTLQVYIYSGSYIVNLQTTQLFRDPSSWYHIVVATDTTQATEANRIKIYVNGSQVTAFSTATYPSQNYDNLNINTASSPQYIGGSSSYFDGYLTEINFIDGQALTPNYFGATDAATGVWQPATYRGTYGTNGFYLPFTDNSALTTSSNVGLGKDFSGNGNYWTTNNISITSGVTYDSMTDVPTLTSATASNFAVMNPLSNKSVTLSEANLKGLTVVDNANTRCNSTISVTSGKWYFETFLGIAGTNTAVGIGQNEITNQYPGADALSFVQEIDNARKGNNNTFTAYGTALVANDTFMCAFDLDNNKIFFGKNGTWFDSSDPAAGTSPAFTLTAGNYTPIFRPYGNVNGYIQTNFGQRPFAYTPPTGFVALNTFNLPTPTIGATASSQADNYFNAVLYTGNGSTQSVSGVGFQPDFVWIKERSSTSSHALVDSVRGAGAHILVSNSTAAEDTSNDQIFTSFNADGFSVGTNNQTNESSQTYVGWNWRANQGTNVTNTAGSITSTVSANTTSGFSVVTYTGTGSNATVGHGLGVAPKMVIVKQRNSTENWGVYHASLPSAAYYLQLNTTAAQDSSGGSIWNSTAPSSSVLTVGTSTYSNANGSTYVAYCFSEVAGFSKFGSYTGNGSSDGPFVYTGFRPRYVMIKNATNGSDGYWWIHDTARDTYNLADKYLVANGADAEGTSSAFAIDILSNGFKVRGTNNGVNGNGTTLIYMAFAESPFNYANAR